MQRFRCKDSGLSGFEDLSVLGQEVLERRKGVF